MGGDTGIEFKITQIKNSLDKMNWLLKNAGHYKEVKLYITF